uniref:FCH and double SH3 domains 2 n=1 Tax=Vombatus ursinus TaxID=29139 RepID=A0A4X2LNG0_VOMUR
IPVISPSPKPHNSLPPLPLYDQPPSSPSPSPDKRSSRYFPRSPSMNENSFSSDSPGFSQPPRHTPEPSYGKLRPVRAAPPPPTQSHRRPTDKMEDVEITLV